MSERMRAATGAEVWVALDLPNAEAAVAAMQELNRADRPYGVKLGLELVTAEGLPKLCGLFHGMPIFVDLKLKDIPATVAGAARSLHKFAPAIFNVHASGGVRMMEAAVQERGDSSVFAVTVLTSMTEDEAAYSYATSSKSGVARFAALAGRAGVQGVICSPADLTVEMSGDILRLCPGIRPAWAAARGDQSRVMTPAEAAVAGADGIVVGRPILSPPEGITRAQALRRVHDEFWLLTELKRLGGILNGHYVYKSGRHGPQYFNKDVLLNDAYSVHDAAQAIIDSLPDGYRFDAVVGPETGGAKLACAIGGIMGQPWTGALKNPDGFWFRSWSDKWREVLIVEDVLTTGGSLDKVVTEVNRLVRGDAERGGRVQMKRALLNRGGVQMAGLETIASLDAVSYPAEECLLCKAGVPISTDAGHAKPKV